MFLRNYYVNEMYRTFDSSYTVEDNLLIAPEGATITGVNGTPENFNPRAFISNIIPYYGTDSLPANKGTANTALVFLANKDVAFTDTTCVPLSGITATLNGSVSVTYDEANTSYVVTAKYAVTNSNNEEVSLDGFAIIGWTGYRQFTSDSANIPILLYEEMFETAQVISGSGSLEFDMTFTYKMPSQYTENEA